MNDEGMAAMGAGGGGIGTDMALDDMLGPPPELDPDAAMEEQRMGAISAAAMDKPKEPVEPGVVRVIGTLFARLNDMLAPGEIPAPAVESQSAALSDELYANLRGLAGALGQVEPDMGAQLDRALDTPGTIGGEQVIDVLANLVNNEAVLAKLGGGGEPMEDETPQHEAEEPVEEPAVTDDDLIGMGG